jgi:hypothetical protein
MIVDVHNHFGYDVVFDNEISEEDLRTAFDANGVDVGIVQPFIVEPLPKLQRCAHDEVYALAKKYPGRFYGMASLNPHCGEEFYHMEMERCMKQLGFVGIKISPIAHSVNPASKNGRMAFEVARGLKVPIMVHSGSGVPFALPSLLLPLAREYKDVPLVIAHSGMNIYAGEAVLVARECDNVYLDTSSTSPSICKMFVKVLGVSKLMFASDLPINQAVELFKWRSLGLSDSDLEWVLGKTATEVYCIKPGRAAC